MPVKPDYRRNQFGGIAGRSAGQGPHVLLRRLSGTASVDRPHRDLHGADAAAAPGHLHGGDRRARAGRSTIRRPRSARRARRFRAARFRPRGWTRWRCRCLQRYPLPTASGVANNFSRTANEVDNQDQWDARIDHKFSTNRDQLFGRLSYFRDGFLPVTPLPDGSGVTSGTLGPQDTTAWSFASNYQHTFSSNLLNEVRVGDTRRTVSRSAAQLASSAGGALNIPGHSVDRAVSQHAADVSDRRLPAARLAAQHRLRLQHQRDGSRRLADVAEGPPHDQGRARLSMGAAERDPAAVADRFVHVQRRRQRPARRRQHRHAAGELPARPGAARSRSICSRTQIQERAHFQEYFIQDDWKVSDRLTLNPGLRYTLNFPSNEINGQTAVFNLQTQQLEYPGTNPVRPLKKNNFGPRMGVVYRLTDKTDSERGLRPGLDRDGGHHHAVHDADVSVPADGVAARARHDQPGVRAAERPDASRRSG